MGIKNILWKNTDREKFIFVNAYALREAARTCPATEPVRMITLVKKDLGIFPRTNTSLKFSNVACTGRPMGFLENSTGVFNAVNTKSINGSIMISV